jgi:hypothetical protein
MRLIVWSEAALIARTLPKRERDRRGIDGDPGPPRRFIAIAMQLAMMEAANGDSVFVADFAPERAGLSEANVMRFGWRTAANDARLL